MHSITAHCLVKNEENFLPYALKSVVNRVDKILIFDTGSTDRTVEIIKQFQKEYPEKIIWEEKGECDPERHTKLRQEMVERTATDWFMILDGDEVWTERTMEEALKIINSNSADGIQAKFYECVGDIYHKHYKESYVTMRFARLGDARWQGGYGRDNLFTKNEEKFVDVKKIKLLKNRFWHLTHLSRSSKVDDDYSSGGKRVDKRIPTYFLVGRKITESAPEVFEHAKFKLSRLRSFVSFFGWAFKKIKR